MSMLSLSTIFHPQILQWLHQSFLFVCYECPMMRINDNIQISCKVVQEPRPCLFVLYFYNSICNREHGIVCISSNRCKSCSRWGPLMWQPSNPIFGLHSSIKPFLQPPKHVWYIYIYICIKYASKDRIAFLIILG